MLNNEIYRWSIAKSSFDDLFRLAQSNCWTATTAAQELYFADQTHDGRLDVQLGEVERLGLLRRAIVVGRRRGAHHLSSCVILLWIYQQMIGYTILKIGFKSIFLLISQSGV